MQRIVDYLRENAGDSIQYRMRREILNVSPHTSEMKRLNKQILNKRKVRKILNTQREDGWFGNELHGVDGVDTCVWRLLNHGVEKSHSTFERVIHVLLHPKEDEPYKRTFPGGPALDLDGRGGDKSVIANTLAMLDHENNEYVIEEIESSLKHFRGAVNYTSVDDFSTATRTGSKRYYKPKAYFPGANHIRLLSATKQWRTPENTDMVKKSFINCMAIMKNEPKEIIWFKHKTHYIGPFNFDWHRFPFSLERLRDDSLALVWWLRILLRISTIGFVREIPELATEYDSLRELLDSNDIYEKQTEKSLKGFKFIWSIEDAWRKEENIKSDLFFLALLILHRAGFVG